MLLKPRLFIGEFSGQEVHILKITLDSNKSKLECVMQRHKFPMITAFAMTIKSSRSDFLISWHLFPDINLCTGCYM